MIGRFDMAQEHAESTCEAAPRQKPSATSTEEIANLDCGVYSENFVELLGDIQFQDGRFVLLDVESKQIVAGKNEERDIDVAKQAWLLKHPQAHFVLVGPRE